MLAQGLPDNTDQLVFRTLQQYDNGQEVPWIDVTSKANPDPEHPAPVLELTREAAGAGSATPTTSDPATSPTSSTTVIAATRSTSWPAIVAIIVAGFTVVLSLLTLWLTRPSMRPIPADEDDASPDPSLQPPQG